MKEKAFAPLVALGLIGVLCVLSVLLHPNKTSLVYDSGYSNGEERDRIWLEEENWWGLAESNFRPVEYRSGRFYYEPNAGWRPLSEHRWVSYLQG